MGRIVHTQVYHSFDGDNTLLGTWTILFDGEANHTQVPELVHFMGK
jgi:hypothetical protein